jgi:hypothetical protein
VDEKSYRKILKEIVQGFSPYFLGEKKHYIKHQSTSDIVDFDDIYQVHYDKARNKGLPTEAEIFEDLEKDGMWSKEDDAEITQQEFYVESLNKNKKNIYLKSAIDQMNKQIKEAEDKLDDLKTKKANLASNCCETYALNRANDFYIFNSFFKDTDLKVPLYTQEEFEHVTTREVSKLVKIYNEFHDRFKDSSIKYLAIQDFYKVYYSFSESAKDFFGKPILELTNFQLSLILYTRIFKNIFEQHSDIPDKTKQDPDALLDYANSSEKRDEVKKKLTENNAGGSSIMGATKEDLEDLGVASSGSKSLHEAAKAKGGSLSMKDIIDLQGP